MRATFFLVIGLIGVTFCFFYFSFLPTRMQISLNGTVDTAGVVMRRPFDGNLLVLESGRLGPDGYLLYRSDTGERLATNTTANLTSLFGGAVYFSPLADLGTLNTLSSDDDSELTVTLTGTQVSFTDRDNHAVVIQ